MLQQFFLKPRWYVATSVCAGLYVFAFFAPALLAPANMLTLVLFALSLLDAAWLFIGKRRFTATRTAPLRLSLGDENHVRISLNNGFRFRAEVLVIDELPFQFQERNWHHKLRIAPLGSTTFDYLLRPLSRGEYGFGKLIVFVNSPLGLVQRRFRFDEGAVVKVYPSFLQLRRYELMANADTAAAGARHIRRIGHSLEFEKIKSYVQGDDVRSINWKASARSGSLMVNVFTDAREQQVYCVIDKGRHMKMPFEGLSLLNYSINAALALMHVALLRQDKAGLLTFSQTVNDIVPAERRSNQQHLLLEALYRQETDFKESDFDAMWKAVRRLGQRSFLILFTNFETLVALNRQLPFLRTISNKHLLCVVLFQNPLLEDLHAQQPDTVEGIYIRTIAERFASEKKQIAKELRRHGILALLTTPQSLSVDLINQYLELKARQLI